MSPGYRETPGGSPGALNNSASEPTRPQFSRPVGRKSQIDRVRDKLLERWVCGVEFLQPDDGPPILRYSSRISEIKKSGAVVARRRCEDPSHEHDAVMYQWRIESVPAKQEGKRCPACLGIACHTSTCKAAPIERQPDQLFGGGGL